MGRRRKRATTIPEGTWPVRMFKSEVVIESGRPIWFTWFRNGNQESRAFFHLDLDRMRVVVERHATALGFVWEGDVLEYLKKAGYADHHAAEGWEGFAEVTFQDLHRYRIRIARDEGDLA